MDLKVFSSKRLMIGEVKLIWEFFEFLLAFRELKKIPIKNKKYPIMILPGFLFSDVYTLPLRLLLKQKGFSCYGWGMGLNKGYTPQTKEKLVSRIDKILEETGSSRIILIGWSMGGIYSRQLAYEYPNKINSVITMATPFTDRNVFFPEKLSKWLSGKDINALKNILTKQRKFSFSVPIKQIYSRQDGFVFWGSCISSQNDNCREIKGTHLGIPFNKRAIKEIFDILNKVK